MVNVTVTIDAQNPGHTISRYLYGHFAEHLGRCIYEGIWVGTDSSIPNIEGMRLDTIEALKALKLPALRWPGGCFADDYHWRDGIGPRDERPVTTNLWWRGVEPNHFGTDEFLRFCELIETEPYLCANVGSGTPAEARDWVEYCTGTQDTTLARERAANGHPEPYHVPFWAVGNESWGCGGAMSAQYYADRYRNFVAFAGKMAGPEAKMIACGSHPDLEPAWDEPFLDALGAFTPLICHSIALHAYTYVESVHNVTDDQYRAALANIGRIRDHCASVIEMTKTKPHPVGVVLDEWGLWYKDANLDSGLFQQSTMLDAVFTAASFHAFHELDGLWMTNMAQTVNVLQALVLTDGPRLLRTPTWWVYEMFMPHRDAQFVPATSSWDELNVSASTGFLTAVNTSLDEPAEITLEGATPGGVRLLTSDGLRDHNTFDAPDRIVARPTDALVIPPHSVAAITLA